MYRIRFFGRVDAKEVYRACCGERVWNTEAVGPTAQVLDEESLLWFSDFPYIVLLNLKSADTHSDKETN